MKFLTKEDEDAVLSSRSKKIMVGLIALLILCALIIKNIYPNSSLAAFLLLGPRQPRGGPLIPPDFKKGRPEPYGDGTDRIRRTATAGKYPIQGPSCRPQKTFKEHPKYRTRVSVFLGEVTIFAHPSLGGVIVLERPDAIDLEFLGLDPLEPRLKRPYIEDDQQQDEEEDVFSKRLLLLGATWWDSADRWWDIKSAGSEDYESESLLAMQAGEIPRPNIRERRWVLVAWPSSGGFWVSEFDTGTVNGPNQDLDNMLPFDTGRTRLARTMDERVLIMKRHFAPKFYERLEDYDGLSYLNEWEHRFANSSG